MLHMWIRPLLCCQCTMATPPIPAQDATRVEVDLIHDAAAVRRGRDAKDALRALVLHETQRIGGGVRIEELVALLRDVGEVMVLDQEHERLVEEDIHLVGVEDVLGLQQVTEGVLDPEPMQGLSQVRETQFPLGVWGSCEPGGGGAAHGPPGGHAAESVDGGALRQTLVEVTGRRRRYRCLEAGVALYYHG